MTFGESPLSYGGEGRIAIIIVAAFVYDRKQRHIDAITGAWDG